MPELRTRLTVGLVSDAPSVAEILERMVADAQRALARGAGN